jgi:hypothetical protein
MQFNHVANRLDPQYFETVVECSKQNWDFVELSANRARFGFANPAPKWICNLAAVRVPSDADKLRSQILF